MMYAFKIAGNRGQYDRMADFNLKTYVQSLPDRREPLQDLDWFKNYQAQYFTPSNLKSGLTRSRHNIADVQAIVFDLDYVPNVDDLVIDVLKVAQSEMELAIWQTPSSLSSGGSHQGGMRLYVPLSEPIIPELLPDAVKELALALIQLGLNVLDYGADMVASKTIGRLMGLPLHRYKTLIVPGTWQYQVTSEYHPPRTQHKEKYRTLLESAPDEFVKAYIRKHNVPDLVLGVNVHNVLQQLIGALERAGFSKDEAIEGLEFLADKTSKGMEDIEREVETSTAYKER